MNPTNNSSTHPLSATHIHNLSNSYSASPDHLLSLRNLFLICALYNFVVSARQNTIADSLSCLTCRNSTTSSPWHPPTLHPFLSYPSLTYMYDLISSSSHRTLNTHCQLFCCTLVLPLPPCLPAQGNGCRHPPHYSLSYEPSVSTSTFPSVIT